MDNLKTLLKVIFQAIFESNSFQLEPITTYFDPSYIQEVNGNILNYAQFIDHIRTLKQKVFDIQIDFKHLITEGSQVTSVHFVSGTKSNGTRIKVQVNAYFKFKNNKISYCNELTHMIKGDADDKDLGSRY